MGIFDYLILAALAVALFFALRHIRRNKGGCAGGCTGCPHAQGCERRESQTSNKTENE